MGKLKHIAVVAATVAAMASAQAATVSEGAAIIPGTFIFDLDTGASPTDFPTFTGGDIWWEMMTPTSRAMQPWTSASSLAYVGTVGVAGLSFNALTATDLAAMTYSSNGIPGGDGVNMLTPNSVFAVKTDQGNYAKVLVTFPFFPTFQNNGLGIYYVTMTAPVPEPETYAMFLAGLCIIGAVARRRRSR